MRPWLHHNRIDCRRIPLPHRSSNDCPFLYLWFLIRAKDSVVGDVPVESISVRLGTNSVAYTRIILADREKAIWETCRLSRLKIANSGDTGLNFKLMGSLLGF